MVRFDSGVAFEPVFQQRQRTGPGENFCKDSPDKRGDMQPPENRARACQDNPANHPENEQRMQEEHAGREYGIEIGGQNSRLHL